MRLDPKTIIFSVLVSISGRTWPRVSGEIDDGGSKKVHKKVFASEDRMFDAANIQIIPGLDEKLPCTPHAAALA